METFGFEHDPVPPFDLELVVTSCQIWMYMVRWVSTEALKIVHERVRKLKAEGGWDEPHPNGATMVVRLG